MRREQPGAPAPAERGPGDAPRSGPTGAFEGIVPLPVLPEDEVGPQPDGPALRSGGQRFVVFLMAGALLSKALGLVREILMAYLLGASMAADGFRAALTATLLPLAFLSNESVPAVIVPMCREWHRTGEAAARLTALTIALTGVAFGLMLGVEALGALWIDALVGGFSPAGRDLTLGFGRVMAFAMPASVMQNCLAAGEIAIGRSRLTTIRASMLNVAVLTGLAVVAVTGQVVALAWAFAIAFNVLVACGLWWLWREGQLDLAGARPALVIATGAEFMRRVFPLLPIPMIEQANIWIERALASRLTAGTVASIDYARSLTDTALLLISQPLGLAVLTGGRAADTRRQVASIARPILAVMLPVSVFVVGFAPEITRIVLARGAFGDTAVFLSSQAMRGIAAGMWASTLGWILIRILNGAGRNGAASIVLTCAQAANIALNLATSADIGNGWSGSLALGLGEATRGVVLLTGTTLLLGCGPQVLSAFLRALPLAAPMALAVWCIPLGVANSLPRCAAGAAVCAACTLLGLWLTVPDLRARLPRIRRGASAAADEAHNPI